MCRRKLTFAVCGYRFQNGWDYKGSAGSFASGFPMEAKEYLYSFFPAVVCINFKTSQCPYFRKRQSELNKQPIEDLLEQMLALFEISFSQFEDMDFETRYLLQQDLLDALVPVIRKHFKVDAYGRKEIPNLEEVINDLENYREAHYLNIYAETVLQKQ